MTWIAFATALGAALIAGAFLAFSSFIMSALARLPAEQGIAAMQSINITVINPLFMGVLFGTGLLGAVLAVNGVLHRDDPAALARGIGGALYVVGVIGVTVAGNVPLNNALAAANPASAEAAALWTRYVSSWTFWNHVRTTMAFLSAIVMLLAR